MDHPNYSQLYVLYKINTTVLNNEYMYDKDDCLCVNFRNKLKFDAKITDIALAKKQMLRLCASHDLAVFLTGIIWQQ